MSMSNFTFSRRLMFSLSIISLTAVALVYSASQGMLPLRAIDISTSQTTATTTFPDPTIDMAIAKTPAKETVVLAGGCFWGMEAVFEHLKGVSNVVTGYSGDSKAMAKYQEVSSGSTEHAESVQITYDPSQISYGQILKIYFAVAHDPTQLNRQGPDSGRQYRSAIFFANDEQKQVAQAYIDQLNAANVFNNAIATSLEPLKGFYAAEEYHQNFIDRNPTYPYVVINDLPKVEHLRRQFPDMYKN